MQISSFAYSKIWKCTHFAVKHYTGMWGIQLIIYIYKNGIFRCKYMMLLSYLTSAFVKINYMQISGRKTWILAFDLTRIIY